MVWKSRKPIKKHTGHIRIKTITLQVNTKQIKDISNSKSYTQQAIPEHWKPAGQHVPKGQFTLLQFWKCVWYEEYNYILSI